MKPKLRWPKTAIPLRLDVWDCTVWLITDVKTRDAVDAYIHTEHEWQQHSPHGWAVHESNDEGHHLFAVYVGDGSIITLVHELDHIAFVVLKSAGVLDIPENQEPHTYTQGCLLRQALKARKWKQ